MENTTFKKEIKYLGQVLEVDGAEVPHYVEGTITKTATFKEFSRTDKSQRDLCWLIMEIFNVKKEKTTIDKEIASTLTDKFINEMLIADADFTDKDKEVFLCDNGAVIKFGLWLVHEKILPFFLKLITD